MDCVGNSEYYITRNFVIYVGGLVLLREYYAVGGCEGLDMWLTSGTHAYKITMGESLGE
jgi:hypothetical protein